MLAVEIVQGRKISGLEIAEIQGLIEANPLWSRWRLSHVVAEKWEWYSTSGELKNMAAGALLLKLADRGLITLPERRHAPRARHPLVSPELFDSVSPQLIIADLAALRPLQMTVITPKQPDYHLFGRYLAQHHYLSYRGPVGQNLGYLVRSRAGVDLACVLFGAAAWQCAPRDRWIGWSAERRAPGVQLIANNSRFLILPWVRVPQIANYILSQIAQRIDEDWQRRYRHRIYLLESFVQQDRFQGACYQAGNWIHVGQTTGRTRQSPHHRDNQIHAPVKDIYLFPLSSDARRQLCG